MVMMTLDECIQSGGHDFGDPERGWQRPTGPDGAPEGTTEHRYVECSKCGTDGTELRDAGE